MDGRGIEGMICGWGDFWVDGSKNGWMNGERGLRVSGVMEKGCYR